MARPEPASCSPVLDGVALPADTALGIAVGVSPTAGLGHAQLPIAELERVMHWAAGRSLVRGHRLVYPGVRERFPHL